MLWPAKVLHGSARDSRTMNFNSRRRRRIEGIFTDHTKYISLLQTYIQTYMTYACMYAARWESYRVFPLAWRLDFSEKWFEELKWDVFVKRVPLKWIGVKAKTATGCIDTDLEASVEWFWPQQAMCLMSYAAPVGAKSKSSLSMRRHVWKGRARPFFGTKEKKSQGQWRRNGRCDFARA